MKTIQRQQTVKKHRFTVEEFHKMGEAGIFGEDERVELIDGEVVEMSPMGWRHIWRVNALNMFLTSMAQGRYLVSVQNSLVVDEHGEPQPDLVLIKEPPPGRLPNTGDALVAVEVSDTTLAFDKNIKLPRYAAAGIPEVWISGLQTETIEVHSTPTPDGYRKTIRYGRADRLESTTIPSRTFDTNEIFPPKAPESNECPS
jgi:Uma2 family endonuclease